MKNRSASEIVPTISDACSGGARITAIMHEVNLSHYQARAYLSELLKAGYLTLDAGEGNLYTTTPDGLKVLQRHMSLRELLMSA